MNIERIVMMFAGIMVLLSLLLTYYVHPLFWLLTAFVGANLIFASLTSFCPLVMVLRKFGLKHGSPFTKKVS